MKIKSIKKIKKTPILDCIAISFAVFGIGRIIWDGYNFIMFLLAMIWIMLDLLKAPKLYFLKEKRCVIFLLFFVLYVVLLIISDDKKTAISYGGTYAIYLIVLLMGAFYYSEDKKKRLRKIVTVSMIWIGIMCICAILYYFKHPGAARLYATHRSDLNGYMIGGGYQLAYISSMLLPVCGRYAIKRKFKTWFTLLGLLMIGLVLKTSSMIIILTAIVGCVVEIAFSGRGKKKVYMLMMTAGVGIFLYLIRANIGQILIDIAGGREVTSFANMNNAVFVRMTEIGMQLKGISVGEYSATVLRIQNYMKPIEEIISHPFLGGILEYGVSPESGVFNDSTIITALSCWGIPMGCLYLYPFGDTFKFYKKHKGAIVAVIMTLLLNPSIGFSVVYGSCFLLPAFDKVYEIKT